MHKRQKKINPSGIKWPTEVDMPLNKTQTKTQTLSDQKHKQCLKKDKIKLDDYRKKMVRKMI